MFTRSDVLIIGAGVSGLSTAVLLARRGVDLRIVSRDPPARTNSCAAAAMCSPYYLTDARHVRWSEFTRQILSGYGPDSGVRWTGGREVSRVHQKAPEWMRRMPEYRPCAKTEIPNGYAEGWWYRTHLVDMPVYLDSLVAELAKLEVTVELGVIDSLDEALRMAHIVVNCAGMDARQLAGDRELEARRGRLVLLENPGITEFFAEYDESPTPIYILPHGDHIVVGGSVEAAADDLVDLVDARRAADAIRRRCADVFPEIERARMIGYRSGLRPTRRHVRLERVRIGDRHVIHNYGHGGSGVTVSWGCASDVFDLVDEVLSERNPLCEEHRV